MTKRVTFIFLISTVLLLISEYFLLHELYAEKRLFVVCLSITGVLISSIGIVKFYRRYKRFV